MKRSWWGALALAAGTVVLLGGCGGSKAPPFNATPAVTNLFPSNITAGSDGFTLAITATGIISSAKGVTFVILEWLAAFDHVQCRHQPASGHDSGFRRGRSRVRLRLRSGIRCRVEACRPVAATFAVEAVANNGPTITRCFSTQREIGQRGLHAEHHRHEFRRGRRDHVERQSRRRHPSAEIWPPRRFRRVTSPRSARPAWP